MRWICTETIPTLLLKKGHLQRTEVAAQTNQSYMLLTYNSGSVAEACQHHRARAAGSGPGPDLACPCVVPCVVEQRSFDLKTSKFQALARVSHSGKETTSGVGACQSCE
jgi:hypothetical protein